MGKHPHFPLKSLRVCLVVGNPNCHDLEGIVEDLFIQGRRMALCRMLTSDAFEISERFGGQLVKLSGGFR